ncbi:MAG: hypothetical protein GC205_00105 [Bacteroidetes bacterium]|nr:hypothetical protein [Bacteroidota bacterium]
MKTILFLLFLGFGSLVTGHAGYVNAQISVADIDPAQAAITVKDISLLKQAMAGGTDINQKFAFHWQQSPSTIIHFEKATLLMYAISMDWYEGVLELLRAGAKSNMYVKGINPIGLTFDRCQVKEIAEMSDMMMAVMAGNPDIVKLMVIDGCDTRGTMAVTLPKNCQTAVALGGLMNMRSLASPEVAELLKEGKKAAWAQNGLPAEGQRPGQ